MRTHGQEFGKSFVSAISLISRKIGFAQALQSLHHYITIPHITSHTNTNSHTFVFNVWQDTDLWDHTMSKQRNKFYSVQGRKLTQEPSQTRRIIVSKRRLP